MDYNQFLFELEQCYADHGIEFPKHMLKKTFDKDWGSFMYKYMNLYGSNPTHSIKHANWHNKDHKINTNYAYSKQKYTTFKNTFSNNISVMVYKIALHLAERIGKLPDHLHARMVMSLDNNIFIKKYIDKFGV